MTQEKLSDLQNNIFSEYIKTRDHYYRNMEKMVTKCDFRKASELLWGAITQSIKALASLSGITIYSHSFFREYTRQVSEEIDDEKYHQTFLFLENLHRNFYDEEIVPIDFPIYIEKANKFLEKTEKLIQNKLNELTKLKSNKLDIEGIEND